MKKTFGKSSEADECSQSLHYSKKGRFVAKAPQNVSKTLFLVVLVTFVYVGFEGEIHTVQFHVFVVGIM